MTDGGEVSWVAADKLPARLREELAARRQARCVAAVGVGVQISYAEAVKLAQWALCGAAVAPPTEWAERTVLVFGTGHPDHGVHARVDELRERQIAGVQRWLAVERLVKTDARGGRYVLDGDLVEALERSGVAFAAVRHSDVFSIPEPANAQGIDALLNPALSEPMTDWLNEHGYNASGSRRIKHDLGLDIQKAFPGTSVRKWNKIFGEWAGTKGMRARPRKVDTKIKK